MSGGLVIHHLNISRSTRTIWLAEELGLDYRIVAHTRDAGFRAPPSLSAVHPLGKSPVIELDGAVIGESGAIVELLCERAGRLAPATDDPERAEYLEWLHFAEGSAMMPVMIGILGRSMGEGAIAGVMPFFGPEIAKVLDHLAAALTEREYLLASGFSGADVMNAYVAFAADYAGLLGERPALTAYRERLLARPALRRAIEAGGPIFPAPRDG